MYSDDASEHFRQIKQDELIRLQTDQARLQTDKLRSENGARSAAANAAIAALLFAAILAFFVFAFRRPKTAIVLLALGYGMFQFLAPVQGSEFNHWVVTLVTNPAEARTELFATLNEFRSNQSSDASSDPSLNQSSGDGSPAAFNANAGVPQPTVAGAEASAPIQLTPPAQLQTPAVAPAAAPVNAMCGQLKWSNPDDLPYLDYYKCPNPGAGD
jgi:hypothetical protein